MKLLDIEVSDKEWDNLMCEQSNGKHIKVVDNKLVAVEYKPTQKELNEQKIKELKNFLSNTDYKAIKYAEGFISEQDYLSIKNQRQTWREEIRKLELLNAEVNS